MVRSLFLVLWRMEKEKKFKKFCCKVQTALSSFSPTFKFPTALFQHTCAVYRRRPKGIKLDFQWHELIQKGLVVSSSSFQTNWCWWTVPLLVRKLLHASLKSVNKMGVIWVMTMTVRFSILFMWELAVRDGKRIKAKRSWKKCTKLALNQHTK